MLAPGNFNGIETALAAPAGWVQLGLVVACFVAGWFVDRAIHARRRDGAARSELVKGASRIAMPVTALALLYVGRIFWRPWGAPLFFDVGIVLALALAAIRILVFTLRRLVPNAHWLRSSERSVAFVVWTLVALHMLGVLPEVAQELDSVRLPLGKAELTLLSLLKGVVAVVLTIAVTLASVTTATWVNVHIFATAMGFFGLFGIAGLYARQAEKSGWLGLAGFVLFSLWFGLIMPFCFVESFILPRLVTESPLFVAGFLGMFTGIPSQVDLGVLPTLWNISGPLYIFGPLLFGIATIRAGVLPRWAGALLVFGALLVPRRCSGSA